MDNIEFVEKEIKEGFYIPEIQLSFLKNDNWKDFIEYKNIYNPHPNKIRCQRTFSEYNNKTILEWNISGSGRALYQFEIDEMEKLYQKFIRTKKLERICK